MDLSSVRAQALEIIFATHGVDAQVLLVGATEPVECRIVWATDAAEDSPAGALVSRRIARRVLALRKVDVPAITRGAEIAAPLPETDGVPLDWIVDSIERSEVNQWRVVVVPGGS